MSNLSLNRILGFACHSIWMFMIFYSEIPFRFAGNPLGTLYHHQILSLFSFVVGCIIIFVIFKPTSTPSRKLAPIAWAGGALMSIGAVLCFSADISTPLGTLITSIAAFGSGFGSSAVFVFWMRLFSLFQANGSLIEYAAGSIVGLTTGLLLLFLPFPFTAAVIVLAPLGDAASLASNLDQEIPEYSRPIPEAKPSSSALRLFAKALGGAFLFGVLQGTTDIISGYVAFAPANQHGVFLFFAGIIISLLMICIGFSKSDSLDTLYRWAMLLMGLGYALMSFTVDHRTFFASVSFGGYLLFEAFIIMACSRISKSFGTGIMRTAAASIGMVYLGEAIGLVAGDTITTVFAGHINAGFISMTCVVIFLLGHLFLFNETDLIHAGIGDMDLVEGVQPPAAAVAAPAEQAQPTASSLVQDRALSLAETYHLSPRETEVLILLLQGRTMARIQEELFISKGTTSTHTRHIYQKTGVSNKQQLLDLAFPKESE